MSLLNKLQSAKNYLMVFGVISIIGLSSCEKDDDNPTNTGGTSIGGSFPTTSGSYWVYEKTETDTNGVVAATPYGMDSTIAGTAYTHEGKTTAVDFTTYSTDESGSWSMEGSKTTYAKESNIVYVSTEEIIGGISEGFPIGIGDVTNIEKWIIAMQDKSSWDMLTFPLDIADFALPGMELPAKMQLKGTLKLAGSKVGTENVTVAGKSYTATKFSMTMSMEADLQLAEQLLLFPKGTKVATIKFPSVNNMYIVEGIGIVKTETLPSSSSLAIAPTFEVIAAGAGITSSITKNGGEITTLIRYNVK